MTANIDGEHHKTELDIIEGSHLYFKSSEAECFNEWSELSVTQKDRLLKLRADLEQTLKTINTQIADVLEGDQF